MSEHVQTFNMVLTGIRRGQTTLLNGHSFLKGVARVMASPESFSAFLTLMGRAYHAYPEGSAELAEADERDKANGLFCNLQNDSSQADGTSASVQSDSNNGSGPISDSRTLLSSVDAEGETGSAGMVSSGSGYEDAGVGQRVEPGTERESDALMRAIQHAVGQMDYLVKEQWTEEGLPSVDYVAEAVKNQTVTRGMIDAVCPRFNRHSAEDLAAL